MFAWTSAIRDKWYARNSAVQIQRYTRRPAGGPLLTKRLAFVGDNLGYLMYAARWFPFHNYAADEATSEITISLPSGYQVIGYSDTPVPPLGQISFCKCTAVAAGQFCLWQIYGSAHDRNGRSCSFLQSRAPMRRSPHTAKLWARLLILHQTVRRRR
jgi:hypothetical protein